MRLRTGLLAVSICLAACGPTGCGEVQRPVTGAIRLHLRQIYDTGAWLRRVPVELAVSLYARVKLERFLAELELPEALHQRLRARVNADDFVDELVPFLLFVHEMYQPPVGESAETFDDHLRAHFAPEDDVPGIEHSMFEWNPEQVPEGPSLPGLAPEVVRELLAFYDVLYLRDRTDASQVEERLACERRAELPALERATRAALPSIRNLLEALGEQMEGQADLGAALAAVLKDDEKLETATAALIRFIDQTVCRNYRFFASRAFRANQLKNWLKAELARPQGGALWSYLEHAQYERRHGVVVVVDGLQGRLVQALAGSGADDAFIARIAEEQRAAGGPAPKAKSLREPAAQQTAFLEAFAQRGYRHPDYLPFFRERLADAHTHWLPVGISTTPTISVRNIPIGLTGAPVAGANSTGLPNFHFVERNYERNGQQQGRAYYFYGSDAVDLVRLTDAAELRTLFERLPEVGSMSCSAQYDERAQFGIDPFVNLGLGEKLRDFGERQCAAELEKRVDTELKLRKLRNRLLDKRASFDGTSPWWRFWVRIADEQDRKLAEGWIEEIAELEQRTLPELLMVYDPWPDHFAHFEGPFADEILAPSGELNRLDYWLGRWQRAYQKAGLLERTVFGLSGDHGLSPVFHLLNPEVEIFDALRERGLDFRVVKISSDEGEGPKLTNPFRPPSMKGIDVVIASTAGGNYMFDLFVDQDAGFARQPLASELRAIRPLSQPDAAPIDLLEEIVTRLSDSLEYLAVRETANSPDEGRVRLIGWRDGERAEALIRRRGNRLHFSFEGADLLDTDRLSPYEVFTDDDLRDHAVLRKRCLGALEDDVSTWCTEEAWRRLCSYTPRPDSVVQLGHLYASERAGTINLFPRAGIGYNSFVPGRHAGESFHEKNALVTVWGPPLASRRAASPLRSAVNGSVPMAVYQHLSGERPLRGDDGWGYTPLPHDWFD